MTALLARLRACVGESHVRHQGDLGEWERDWSGSYAGRCIAAVLPSSTQELAAVVKVCAENAVPMVVQGGNTGMVGGGVPDDSGQQVVISTRRLNRIRAVDPENLTITVEAGCILQSVQALAAEQGLLFPLSLAAEGSCTVGGNLATNAGGTQVLRYGNAREQCLGLEVVTAAGEIWNGLSGLRKDNTGYALRDLFVGSEGTLGIITAATLKLQPRPRSQLTAWAVMDTVEDAVALLSLARGALGPALTSFELMSRESIGLVRIHEPSVGVPQTQDGAWSVLIEASAMFEEAMLAETLQGLLEDGIARPCIRDAVLATSLAQSMGLWRVRESLPLAQAAAGPALRHDISFPVSCVASFLRETGAALAAEFPGVQIRCFGHLGDGNLHYNMQAPAGCDAAAFLGTHRDALHEAVWSRVMRLGGSIAAEHGIGQKMVEPLGRFKSPVALGMMRGIKQALDPHNLLNPSRVLTRAP